MKNMRYDIACPKEVNHLWYDYYVREALHKAMKKKGYIHTPGTKNLRIYMLGFPIREEYPDIGKFDKDAYNVAWILGHPNQMKNYNLEEMFDKIIISSDCIYQDITIAKHQEGMNKLPDNATFGEISTLTNLHKYHNLDMPSDLDCTNEELENRDFECDIRFLGSPRPIPGYKEHGRKIVYDLCPKLADLGFSIEIAGYGWEKAMPQSLQSKLHIRPHVPREEFGRFMRGAKVVLHDHHPMMGEMGMVSHKLIDTIACGAYVVSDYNREIEENMEFIPSLSQREQSDYLWGVDKIMKILKAGPMPLIHGRRHMQRYVVSYNFFVDRMIDLGII